MGDARSLMPEAPPPPGSVFAGKVARIEPRGVTLDVYGTAHEWGPVTWMAAGTPERGDACLVFIDTTGGTWAFPVDPVSDGATDTVEAWQSLAPYLGAGWTTSGTVGTDWEAARFRADRERVYFAGLLTFSSAAGGAVADRPVDSMPVDYRPALLTNVTVHTDPDNTRTSSPDTRNAHWTGDWLTTGRLLLDTNQTFIASPNFGACPDQTVLYLDELNYSTS